MDGTEAVRALHTVCSQHHMKQHISLSRNIHNETDALEIINEVYFYTEGDKRTKFKGHLPQAKPKYVPTKMMRLAKRTFQSFSVKINHFSKPIKNPFDPPK